jgi:hypothetical protein
VKQQPGALAPCVLLPSCRRNLGAPCASHTHQPHSVTAVNRPGVTRGKNAYILVSVNIELKDPSTAEAFAEARSAAVAGAVKKCPAGGWCGCTPCWWRPGGLQACGACTPQTKLPRTKPTDAAPPAGTASLSHPRMVMPPEACRLADLQHVLCGYTTHCCRPRSWVGVQQCGRLPGGWLALHCCCWYSD